MARRFLGDTSAPAISDTRAESRRSQSPEKMIAATVDNFATRVLPCLCYAASSVYMTMAQKYVVTNDKEIAALFLLYQNLAALVMFVPSRAGWLRRFKIQPYRLWDSRVAWQVAPLGVTYSVMLYSSNCALGPLSVPMISVLKNIGPILITVVEAKTEAKPLSWGLILSMVMLVSGSVVAGYHDLQFDVLGYSWMAVNVCANVVHVQLMKRVQQRCIPKAEILHYQTLVMSVLLLPLLGGVQALVDGTYIQSVLRILERLMEQKLPVLVAFVSTGVNGVVIALCTMWAIEATSGSTYSMVGALNKIPSSILGIYIFNDAINWLNLAGVAIGLGGGIVFSLDKAQTATPAPMKAASRAKTSKRES